MTRSFASHYRLKTAERSEASGQIKSNFIFLTRSFASRFWLRLAQLFWGRKKAKLMTPETNFWLSRVFDWLSKLGIGKQLWFLHSSSYSVFVNLERVNCITGDVKNKGIRATRTTHFQSFLFLGANFLWTQGGAASWATLKARRAVVATAACGSQPTDSMDSWPKSTGSFL